MEDRDLEAKWLQAGIVLGRDRTANVPCPVCGEAQLAVTDVAIKNTDKFERYMSCPVCKATNVMLMRVTH